MAALAGKDLVWCGFYLGGSECAIPARLISQFPADLLDGAFEPADFARELGDFAASAVPAGPDDQRALGMLVRAEARRIAAVLEDPRAQRRVAQHADKDEAIRRAFSMTMEYLDAHEITVSEPVCHVVDVFPPPYQERTYAILTADAGDEEKYGVTPGLYIARDKMRPFYTEALVCHELIHVALGEKSPELMGRGLEEGIAEFLGSIVLSYRQVGAQPTFWIEVFNRNSSIYDLFWEHYNDFLRMAYLLYSKSGLGGLLALVARGREAIKEVERELVRGRHADIRLPDGRATDVPAELASLIERIVLGFPRSMIVSPPARVVADHCFPGRTVEEISVLTGFGEETVVDAVKELAESAVVIGRRADGFVVTSSDLDLYLDGGLLRFLPG